MQEDVLRRFETRPGADYPAGPRTLQYALRVGLKPEADKAELVAAIEYDPDLLVTALVTAPYPLQDLTRWSDQFPAEMLRTIVLASAVNPPGQNVANVDDTSRSLKRSLLAGELARVSQRADRDECRLVALLSGPGWVDPSRADNSRSDNSVSDTALSDSGASAELLESLGCSRRVCDAVRYQAEALSSLTGTDALIQVNALSGRLISYTDHDDALPDELLSDVETLLHLDGVQLSALLGNAARRFDQVNRLLDDALTADIQALLAASALSALFYRAVLHSEPGLSFEALLTEASRQLLGAKRVGYFTVEGRDLVCLLDDIPLRLPQQSAGSFVAQSYRNGEMLAVTLNSQGVVFAEAVGGDPNVSADGEHGLLVAERQLLQWLGSEKMFCLPLGNGAGVLVVSGVNMGEPERGVLLQSLIDAANDVFHRFFDSEALTIGVEQVQHKAREITHEVNNPLAILQNYLHTLAIKLGDDAGVQQEIDAMSKEVKRISAIVEKYAGIGGPEKLAYSVTDLNRLVEDLVLLMRGSSPGVSIETRLDNSIPALELAGDAVRQVTLNLLKNAVEALVDVANPRILVTTEGAVNVNGRAYLEVGVSDNGPGLSQRERLELFNSMPSSKGEHRGLGLGIVRDLLNEMSGSVSCRASDMGGASFKVLIPVGER